VPIMAVGSEKHTSSQFLWGVRSGESPVALEKPGMFSQALTSVRAEGLPILVTIPSPKRQIDTESVSSTIYQLFTQLQLQGVQVGQQSEVYEYLLQFPDMIEVVEQAVFIARNHLGKEAQLQLEVYHDPENEDEHLVLYARFLAYDETVMEKIRAARRRYRHLLHGKSGWFILTTDFQQPK
jgi:hypothetical protein